MECVEIIPSGPIDVECTVPGSKSITNRALICAALAEGESVIRNASLSDDSRAMGRALLQLGVVCREDGFEVRVCGGRVPEGSVHLDLGNAGTAVRFLTSYLCLGRGTFVVDGNERMRERPIADLVDALRQWGVRIRYLGREGCPPIEIVADGLVGGRAEVRGDVSSQYLSSLLMVAPYTRTKGELVAVGHEASKPYVEMTRAVMAQFGVAEQGGHYRATEITVEADAAAAGYWFAAAAITAGRARIMGLGEGCAQPEIALVGLLQRMGCTVERSRDWTEVRGGTLRGIEADMNACPDSVPTLAVIALAAEGKTHVTNVRHLRMKESDRLAALARELGKLGAQVVEHAGGLEITPPVHIRSGEVETYEDHRMAMSFAVLGTRVAGIVIQNPDCVWKSYPGFWGDLVEAGVSVRPIVGRS